MHYGYLGVSVREPGTGDADWAIHARGVIVEHVELDGPAERAGVQVGDLITRFGDEPVDSPLRLAQLVGQTPLSREVALSVLRAGHPLELRATLAHREGSRVAWLRSGAVVWRGVRLANPAQAPTSAAATWSEGAGVVVIGVAANSPAHRAALQTGNVIEAVGETPVTNVAEFLQTVRAQRGSVSLIVRDRGRVTIAPQP